MFTADGLRFHEPVTIDGQTMQNFVWKNELISFVCTDEGATGVKLAVSTLPGIKAMIIIRALIRWIFTA